MPIDPNIPLSGRPVESPLDSYSKALGLKAMLQQQQAATQMQQLRDQQIQAGQLENQQRQMENQQRQKSMQDQNWFTSNMSKYATRDENGNVTGYDYDSFYDAAGKAGVSPQSIQAFQKAQNELTESKAKATEAQRKTDDANAQWGFNRMQSMRPITDAVARQNYWMDTIAQGKKRGMDVGHLQPQAPQDDKGVDDIEAQLGMYAQINADAKAKAGIAADLAKKTAAETGQKRLEAEMPGGGLNRVTQAIQIATNPQVQAARLEVAKAGAEARAALADREARGSDPALANVPKGLVSKAAGAAEKAGQEHAQSLSVTQRLNAMMDAARSGNVVSYQVMPMEGVLQIATSQGVHRINLAEIHQYAGAGSAWERLLGRFGKETTGRSIPTDVLNDMAEIQKIVADGAKTKYENALKVINKSYGSNFQPVEMDTGETNKAAGKPAPGMIRIRASDGYMTDIPAANLQKAKDRDKNLQVISQ
jgi:hypothetical protein